MSLIIRVWLPFREPSALSKGEAMAPHPPPFVIHALALALVKSTAAPVLLLDGGLTVLAASTSFCRTFQLQPDAIENRRLAEIGSGEWSAPQLAALLTATSSGIASVHGYEMDFMQKGDAPRKLVASATKLDYADGDVVWIILTITDVTDARAAEELKDSLLREKDVLLKEVHHRVANSLQIIASVLMQNARTVQSEESRLHLTNAHQRVMSVAALQKQLSVSSLDVVNMRIYLTNLCRSIGASMIPDPRKFTLTVRADEGVLPAETSVSVGLIVTELVINSLKHAFEDQESGHILVGYHSTGSSWTLSVSDNGIGMPSGSEAKKGGLGTSIVQALAAQLNANIDISDAAPGTAVTISHLENASQKSARAFAAV